MRKGIRKNLNYAIYTFFWILYWLMGAWVFYVLEHEDLREKVAAKKTNPVDFKQKILDEYSNLTETSLNQIIDIIIKAHENGQILEPNSSAVEDIDPWNFHNSIYFATTVLTTIGYGTPSPKTIGGKAFCCVFAIIGIPLTLTFLAVIGIKIHKFSAWLGRKITLFADPKYDRVSDFVIIITMYLLIILCLPTVLFKHLENWTYSDSFYYSVITLTTVGFGDYQAALGGGNDWKWTYMWFTSLWIYLGLAWFAAMFSAIQNMLFSAVRNEDIILVADEEETTNLEICNDDTSTIVS